MAAPQHATMTYTGLNGRSYTKDLYISDVAAALVNFDAGGAASATTPDFYNCPVAGYITDVSITTGLTATGRLQTLRNGIPAEGIIEAVAHVTTAAKRPPLAIPFNKGDMLQFNQLA